MKKRCFLAGLLIWALMFGCDERGQRRPTAAPIYHQEKVEVPVIKGEDFPVNMDGEIVTIKVQMEALEKYWGIQYEYLWFMDVKYHVPRPYALRLVDKEQHINYYWDDDHFEEKFHKNLGNQRFARQDGPPHRDTAEFWLKNETTGNKVKVELPIWR